MPRRLSVYDAIGVITGNDNPRDTWSDLTARYPGITEHTGVYKFDGKGQRNTPVTGAKGAVVIMNLLPGRRAAEFRAIEADVLIRYLGGDPSLIAEVQGIRWMQEQLPQDDPARLFGEEVEAGRTSGAGIGHGFSTAAELKRTADMLNAFPFVAYNSFLDAKERELQIERGMRKEREFRLDLDKKRARLDAADQSTKRNRSDTDKGVVTAAVKIPTPLQFVQHCAAKRMLSLVDASSDLAQQQEWSAAVRARSSALYLGYSMWYDERGAGRGHRSDRYHFSRSLIKYVGAIAARTRHGARVLNLPPPDAVIASLRKNNMYSD